MTKNSIQQYIERVVGFYEANPEKTRSTDKAATAVVESGLRVRVTGPGGETLISDMPKAIGGKESAPTPGWLLRAALASCDTTLIAMRAAMLGITLTRLEIHVDSESDDKGLLGMDEVTPAGPLQVRTRVAIGAAGADERTLQEIVHWAERHSPVADALRRSVPVAIEIVVG